MSKNKPPAVHIEWAKHLRAQIPGDTIKVTEHLDEGEKHQIDIFTSANDEGIVAATIGLMEYDQSAPGKPPLNTEILVDSQGPCEFIAHVAATIAFFIIKDRLRVAPGFTFAKIISMYDPWLQVEHVLFVPPFQWRGMSRVSLSDRTIYPLLAVPITDSELNFVQRQGADQLQERWERESTNVLDWSRDGVV